MKRLYNLDYLRGLAAFGIMIYHYLSWSDEVFSAGTFMGRIGIYGVSIFYVLSGLTLHYVYYAKMRPSKEQIISFFRKRFFRIFPLLWLVTIIAIILSGEMPNPIHLFLNLSGLFGFIRWEKYFSPGVWSIGNELVFYVFFPLFLLLMKKYKPVMSVLASALLGLYLYFAFVELNPDLVLSKQWKSYINPLNQVFIFLGGFLIGHFSNSVNIKAPAVIGLLISGFALFALYPVTGDLINLVTGTNRLIFTACCFLICFCFFKLPFRLPTLIHEPLTLLGEASYSIYLIHPIVWTLTGVATAITSKFVFNIPQPARILLSVSLTLVISYFVYQYFEKYFMKIGRTKKDIIS